MIFPSFKCFLLKQEHFITVRLPTYSLCITKKGDTLAIFQMQLEHVTKCKEQVDKVLTSANIANARLVNPFDNIIMNQQDIAFLKLGKTCQFFMEDLLDDAIYSCEQVPPGKGFKGRVIFIIKGVMFSKDKGLVAPIIVVQQVLHSPYHHTKPHAADINCILADDNDGGDDDATIILSDEDE